MYTYIQKQCTRIILFYFILINYNSNALFGNYLHLWGYQSVEVDDLITKLLISERTHGSFLFCFLFSAKAKKVIHKMPPSHFLDLRLVRTNLDKEGSKFQLEEHVVAGILEAWGLQESHYHCEFQHCLCNNIRWIKKSVFNLKCTSVFHVFKLSTDYEELWKGKNQIPAVIIRCLQKVHKVRFTVVKAQIFPTLTYGDYIILISTL